MKKALLFLSVFFSLQLFAQTDFRFADSTAQWNVLDYEYLLYMPSYTATIIYNSCGDTVVDGKSYQKICGANPALYLIRQDSTRKVFLRSDTTEQKIYDFGSTINDTVFNGFSGPGTPVKTIGTVHSIDSVYLGKWRKRMHITFVFYNPLATSADTLPYKIEWIDGIGATNNHFLNPNELFYSCEGCPYYSLLCFFENDARLYHDDFYNDTVCNFYKNYLGIEETKENLVSVFPNPSFGTAVSIQLPETPSGKTQLQLFDLTGRMILQKPLTEKTTRLQLDGIAKGMYLYNINSNDEKNDSGKLIIE